MKKIYDKLTENKLLLKGTIGVSFCLFSLIGVFGFFVSDVVISNFIAWIFSFLFGYLAFFFFILLFVIGLSLIFSKKWVKHKFSIFHLGSILVLLGFLILVTNSKTSNETEYLTFSNFFDHFSLSIQGFPKVNLKIISGGLFGFLLVALINTLMTEVGSLIFGIVFLSIGSVLVLFKPVIKIIKHYKSKQLDIEHIREAKDVTQFDTDAVATRTTDVITNNDELPENVRQTTVVSNPNGGIGTAYVNTALPESEFTRAHYDFQKKQRQSDLVVHDIDTNVSETNISGETIEYKKKQTYTVDIPIEETKNSFEDAKYQPEVNKEIEFSHRDTIDIPINQNDIESDKPKKVNVKKYVNYQYPPLDLLIDRPSNANDPNNIKYCEECKVIINQAFEDFKIGAQITGYTIGPSVTRFDVLMDRDKSVKTVNSIIDDISTRLNGVPTRFVQVVPGKNTSGLEIANKKKATVNFKDCLKHLIDTNKNQFTLCFGKDIGGSYVDADIRDFPHLLVSGTTGSGKSVYLYSLITTLMMRNKPSEVKFILVDPKHVALTKYRNSPFLLCPVVEDATEATLCMEKLYNFMNERFNLLREYEVEDLAQYNKLAKAKGFDPLPYIVVVVDEFANITSTNKNFMGWITQLVGLGRGAGIILVLSTQYPTTTVITGIIKANIATRIALLCANSIASQVIIDKGGAEKLLGNGDMLISTPLLSKTENVRVQSSFMSPDDELRKIMAFLKEHYSTDYDEEFCNLVEKSRMQNVVTSQNGMPFDEEGNQQSKENSDEQKYEQIKDFVITQDYFSISKIARMFNVGFNRAGKIFDRLVADGVLSNVDEGSGGNKGRKVINKQLNKSSEVNSAEQTRFYPDENK